MTAGGTHSRSDVEWTDAGNLRDASAARRQACGESRSPPDTVRKRAGQADQDVRRCISSVSYYTGYRLFEYTYCSYGKRAA